jgi:hypothetical protein
MRKSLILEAVKVAKSKISKHTQSSHAHYSFIVQNNCIVGYGVNQDGEPLIHWGYKRMKEDPTYSPKIHSEIHAYKKNKGIMEKGKTFEIINIRLNKLGELRNSKPCKCCSTLLRDLGCIRFYYSSDCGFLNS